MLHSSDGDKVLHIDEQIEIPGSGWIAARAVSNHLSWHVWPVYFSAHTSPIYVKAGGNEVFNEALGQYLITTKEGGLEWLDTLATRADEHRHSAIKQVFHDAIGKVNSKMPHHHGDGNWHSH